jgi:hypothetical protein
MLHHRYDRTASRFIRPVLLVQLAKGFEECVFIHSEHRAIAARRRQHTRRQQQQRRQQCH